MIDTTTVESASREVLETSARMAVRKVSSGSLAEGDDAELVATLSLSGQRGGTLVVHCDWRQAVLVAEGMLGAGLEADPETVHDALGEVVNQIGGSIKRQVGGDGSDMVLSPPVVVSGSPLRHCVKVTAEPCAVALELDEGALHVCLWPA